MSLSQTCINNLVAIQGSAVHEILDRRLAAYIVLIPAPHCMFGCQNSMMMCLPAAHLTQNNKGNWWWHCPRCQKGTSPIIYKHRYTALHAHQLLHQQKQGVRPPPQVRLPQYSQAIRPGPYIRAIHKSACLGNL